MESKTDIQELLADYYEKTTPLLRSYLTEKINDAKKIGKINVEILQKFLQLVERGKKIRGMLVVLGYQVANGKDMNSILNASLFIEIMHCGALIHDDIMDNDDYRRGMPTIHQQFLRYGKHNSESLAIMAGDMAFYLSWDKLLNSNFSRERLIKAGKIYTQYALNTVYGQSLDALNGLNWNISEQEILNIFRYKTAEYTGVLPLLVGATLGGMLDKKKLKALNEYGFSLGWAFQIRDDIIGLFGSEEKTGKPVGSDLREGKITLLVHYVIKNGSSKEKNYLKKILGNKSLSNTDILKAQKFFEEVGAYQHVKETGWQYVEKGKKSIRLFTQDSYLQGILESLITFVMNRIV